MLLLAFACAPAPEPVTSTVSRVDTDPSADTAGDTGGETAPPDTGPLDTGPPDTAPPDTGGEPLVLSEQFDVIVVGAGPAGVAAALSAREAGASVLLLDRAEEPGMGLLTGGQAYAAASRWQLERGIEDSLEAAAADWADITGADPAAPGVADFLANSAGTLEWLEGYGLRVDAVRGERDAGLVPRVHDLDWSAIGDARGLYTLFDGELRAGVEVTAPVMEDGAVVGVVWTDVLTGEVGASGAGAVVIATGGFVRDRDEVDRWLPEAAGRRFVFEANYHSDGGGLPFLDAVGAARLAPGQIGVYVHSMQDPDLAEGESILVLGVEHGILVDAAGERFANETLQRSFDLFDALPEGDIYAVLAGAPVGGLLFTRPAYNWTTLGTPEMLYGPNVDAVSDELSYGASLEEVAAAGGIDFAGLQATVDTWNATLAAGGVDPYGRNLAAALALDGETWAVVRLTPGLAKNFGGVSTDADARVLDVGAVPIPGLYAAGEVAGMVIGGGGGDGFSGSVGACYWGGRVAGAEAAAFSRSGAR